MSVILCSFCSCFSYNQLNPLFFSLAYTGVLVRRNPQQRRSSKNEPVSGRDSSLSGIQECVAAHKERNEKEGEKSMRNQNKNGLTVCVSSLVPIISSRSQSGRLCHRGEL